MSTSTDLSSSLQPMENSLKKINRPTLLSSVRRIVVKVGSSTLTEGVNLSVAKVSRLVEDLSQLKQKGIEVILVTSGAIAAGRGQLTELFQNANGPKFNPSGLCPIIPELQAAAAVGQIHLMNAYKQLFEQFGHLVGMILVTQDDFDHRQRYTHISDTIRTLLRFGVIPIINENDTVAVDEIKVGDNDTISAYVTNLVEADLLVVLSDQAGFYTQDPRKHSSAQLIAIIDKITDDIWSAAGEAGTDKGTGGMRTKLRAAEIVTGSGKMMVIADGSKPMIVSSLLAGESIGTLFLPAERTKPMSARQRWIAYSRPARGVLFVDDGAKSALLKGGKSLLPSGIRKTDGNFKFGDTVSCKDQKKREFARGLVNYNTSEVEQIKGKQTCQLQETIGDFYYDEVIHRDNLVLLN